ncbi:MAG: hypothetical protein CMF42_02460 [Legionellales bacterium]|nr:hypothetical protein [Legionellales bacterium]
MSSSVDFGTRILISTTISAFAFALVNFSLIYLHLPSLIYFSLAGLSNNGCNLVFGGLWGLFSSILMENYGFLVPEDKKETSYRNFFKQFLFMMIFSSCASIVFTFVQTFYFAYLPVVAMSAVWLMIGSVLALNTNPGEANLLNIIFSSLIVIGVGFGIGLVLGIYFDFASIQGIFNQDWILMPVITSLLSLFVSVFLADNGVSRIKLAVYIAMSTITLIAMISLSNLTVYYPLIVHLLLASNFHFAKMFLIVDMRYFSNQQLKPVPETTKQAISSQYIKLVKVSFLLEMDESKISDGNGWAEISQNLKSRLEALKNNEDEGRVSHCVALLNQICQKTNILSPKDVSAFSSLLQITPENKDEIRGNLLYFNNLDDDNEQLRNHLSESLTTNDALDSITRDIKNAIIDFLITRWTDSINTYSGNQTPSF